MANPSKVLQLNLMMEHSPGAGNIEPEIMYDR